MIQIMMGGGSVEECDGADNTSTTAVTPAMTSATAPSGEVDASSYANPYLPFNAFDNSSDTGWMIVGSTGWIEYKWDNDGPIINKYIIYVSSLYEDTEPKDWTIEGSNTGSFSGEETVLDTVTGHTTWTDNDATFTFLNSTAYKYIRMNITENAGEATTLVLEILYIEAQC